MIFHNQKNKHFPAWSYQDFQDLNEGQQDKTITTDVKHQGRRQRCHDRSAGNSRGGLSKIALVTLKCS